MSKSVVVVAVVVDIAAVAAAVGWVVVVGVGTADAMMAGACER